MKKSNGFILVGNIIAALLLPLAVVYFFAKKAVYISRSFWQKSSKTPVISIDCLSVFGTDRTLVIREIATILSAPVVMNSRGKAGAPVRPTDPTREVGADAKMLTEAGLSVYVGNLTDNITAINYAVESRPKAIVLNGGFQNPAIKKDVSILVFDERTSFGNGFLLPAGPMRETLAGGIKRADAVLIIHGGDGAPPVRVLDAARKYKKPVFFAKTEIDKKGLFGKCVAFAGGPAAEAFFDALRGIIGMRIVGRAWFPKRYFLGKSDIIRLFRMAREYGAGLITTERDWIKLPRNIRAKVRRLPVKMMLQPNFYSWLDKKLERKNEEK